MSENNVVPVSEMDYLEEDAPIRGQNFACVSFISPEKVLDDKKVFVFTKFTQNFCKEVNELFQNMKIKYPDDDDAFKAIADRYRFLFNEKHMQEEFKYFEDEKEENRLLLRHCASRRKDQDMSEGPLFPCNPNANARYSRSAQTSPELASLQRKLVEECHGMVGCKARVL